MSERFQTLHTRLRPHRIAVLTDVDDPDWQDTCLAIVEYLTQVWGGYYSLIIPTNGKEIDTLFWGMLSAFDPDLIFFYKRTLHDLKRRNPAEFQERLSEQLQKVPESLPEQKANLPEAMLKWPLDKFAISPELVQQLLSRLNFFHHPKLNHLQHIHLDQTPGYPLTQVIDVIPVVQAPDAIFVLMNNLPTGHTAPPRLWLRARSGSLSDAYQSVLVEAGVTPVPKLFNEVTLETLVRWGINPSEGLGPSAPFSFSLLALAGVRSVFVQPYGVPSVIVRGDTLKDFCLYYALTRLHGRAIWLPSWFLQAAGEHPTRIMAAVYALDHLALQDHADRISLLSTSVPSSELRDLRKIMAEHSPATFTVDDGNDPHFLHHILDYPGRYYVKKNIDRITTHQLLDDKLPGFFESPVPEILSEIKATKHRWLVEIAFNGHQIPRHPVLNQEVAQGIALDAVRTGIDGVALQCPGGQPIGDDIELQMLRVTISVPPAEKIFKVVLKSAGFETIISDKGAFEGASIQKFGGLTESVQVLRDCKKLALLKKFLDHKPNQAGVFDEGCFLNDDRRRYLDFAPISKILGEGDAAAALIDDWVSKKIMHRGFLFKCARCSNASWFAVDDLTQEFTCPRCATTQQYTRAHWLRPHEPSWYYKLDEIVYQMLRHNGDVAIVTLAALKTLSPFDFIFTPELKLTHHSDPKRNMELDICCIMSGRIIIGEAKSNDSLRSEHYNPQQVVDRYRNVAELMGASGIVFSTAQEAWNAPSEAAINNLRLTSPLLRIRDFRSKTIDHLLKPNPPPSFYI